MQLTNSAYMSFNPDISVETIMLASVRTTSLTVWFFHPHRNLLILHTPRGAPKQPFPACIYTASALAWGSLWHCSSPENSHSGMQSRQ